MEIKDDLVVSLLLVSLFERLTSVGRHDFRHVVVDGRHGSHVLLVFGDVELVEEVALFDFGEPKGFGKRREGHLEEAERINETADLVASHLQEFTPVADLFHLFVVGIVVMHHEIPIVPLKIVSNDLDGTRVVQGQGIQPFQKLLDTLVSSEAKLPRVVFGFGNEQIGHVMFLGLHGLDAEEHVQGCEFFVLIVAIFLTVALIGLQGLEAFCGTPFSRRTTSTLTFSFAFFVLLFEFLWSESSLSETTAGMGVDVLMAGRTIHVPAMMMLNVFEPKLQSETGYALPLKETDGFLMDLSRFSIPGFGAMGFVTGVSEKVSSTVMTSSGGFETPWVGVKEIGTMFLATGTTLNFLCASVTFVPVVVGFETGSTDVTFVEERGETGDDIVIPFFVEQDQLFAEG